MVLPLDSVRLKNGYVMNKYDVHITMLHIDELFEEGVPGGIASVELYSLCKGEKTFSDIDGKYVALLQKHRLLQLRTGALLEDAKNVVLSSATGERSSRRPGDARVARDDL